MTTIILDEKEMADAISKYVETKYPQIQSPAVSVKFIAERRLFGKAKFEAIVRELK